jgi:hypothetical protein
MTANLLVEMTRECFERPSETQRTVQPYAVQPKPIAPLKNVSSKNIVVRGCLLVKIIRKHILGRGTRMFFSDTF